eukprot:m.158351 g.158351  ORF g.158351 m.158351 type:complete len:294 (+) comp31086_c0_seq1:328-1209(+)
MRQRKAQVADVPASQQTRFGKQHVQLAPPSRQVPNFIWYWSVLVCLFGAAYIAHPWVVTSTYLTSCCLLGLLRDRVGSETSLQHKNVRKASSLWRRRTMSIGLSLLNCLIADSLMTIFVRDNSEFLYTFDSFPSLSSAVYTYLSPLLLLLLHDAWFYFSHRLMHRSKFAYQWIHSLHHQRTNPEAWDLFYMHPIESVVTVVLPFLLSPRLLPLHWLMWEGLIVKGVMIDCYGHCGFDTRPFHPFKVTQFSLIPSFPYRALFLDAKHHDDHHRLVRGNFALYLNIWDNVCGTSC